MYLDESHVSLLREEPEYVKKRYQAVARTLSPFGVTRERAAELVGRSKRQLQRYVRRFKEEGIAGLRHRSKRPHTAPKNKPLSKSRGGWSRSGRPLGSGRSSSPLS
ncbi:MAG: helix-turn-helix domain-containing protein [Nitrososphaerota archaeon]|nr:helix-turn-helix domain-containing protein [Nitrososphaerota archaeon]